MDGVQLYREVKVVNPLKSSVNLHFCCLWRRPPQTPFFGSWFHISN